jgi:hypothetical protein
MAPKKISNRLKALDVTRRGSGMHLDGAGLYLQVTERGRSWLYRFKSPVSGKTRDMGLGPVHTFGLARARELATEVRGQVRAGLDPIEARKTALTSARLEASKAVTFETAVENYIEAHRNSWRTEKHEAQLRSMQIGRDDRC